MQNSGRQRKSSSMAVEPEKPAFWTLRPTYKADALASLATLKPIRDHGPLPEGVIPLVSVMRNERTLIEAFLRHYRQLGVGRFMIVDHDSTDGTTDILAAAPDVDLWRATGSFRRTNFGFLWQEALLATRARGRWIVTADCDEFLVFGGYKTGGLRGLIENLRAAGEARLLAPMLDMYSDRSIRDSVIRPGSDPISVCTWFDPGPEIVTRSPAAPLYRGGPQRRVFSTPDMPSGPILTKYPVLLYDDATTMSWVHGPMPYDRNFPRPKGRLLHVKLHAEIFARAQTALHEGQHAENGKFYRLMLQKLEAEPNLTLHSPLSRKYESPRSLIAAGLMVDATRSRFASSRRKPTGSDAAVGETR